MTLASTRSCSRSQFSIGRVHVHSLHALSLILYICDVDDDGTGEPRVVVIAVRALSKLDRGALHISDVASDGSSGGTGLRRDRRDAFERVDPDRLTLCEACAWRAWIRGEVGERR